MKIKSIRESEFNLMEGVRQIIVHDYSHKFAILDLGEKLGSYGISWRYLLCAESPGTRAQQEISKQFLTRSYHTSMGGRKCSLDRDRSTVSLYLSAKRSPPSFTTLNNLYSANYDARSGNSGTDGRGSAAV